MEVVVAGAAMLGADRKVAGAAAVEAASGPAPVVTGESAGMDAINSLC